MFFLAIFLGTIVGIIVIVFYIYFRITNGIKKTVGNQNYEILKKRFKEGLENGELFGDNIGMEPKTIGGMTDMLEPKIRKDFDDFHSSELFNLNNKCLKAIFNALESKDISGLENDSVFDLIKQNIHEQIQDMATRNINVSYDDVRINRNTIKSYTNDKGSAIIEVNTSLSYFYKSNNSKEKSYEKFRKETRLTTKFIYVYDVEKFDGKSVTYAVNCPNCGAPVASKGGKCKYCGTYVEGVDLDTINLKSWRLISYNEY